MTQLQRDVARLDRMLDAILDHQLQDERLRMRQDDVDERDIRAFARDKRARFEMVTGCALAEAIAFVTGRPIVRTNRLH